LCLIKNKGSSAVETDEPNFRTRNLGYVDHSAVTMKKILLSLTIILGCFTSAHAAVSDAAGSNATAVTDAAASSINILEQNYAASQPVPGMPGMVSGPVISPSLFNLIGRPAHITGLPLWSQILFIPDRNVETRGASGSTRIIFNGCNTGKHAAKGPGNISLNLSGVAAGEIAGAITIETREGRTRSVDFPTLIYDAADFIRHQNEFKESQVTLLSIPEAMSFTMGVDSKSNGISASSALSHFFDGTLGLLAGTSAGAASSSGTTSPTGSVGCTFLVVVNGEHNRTIDISSAYRQYTMRINGQPVNRKAEVEENEGKSTSKERQAESVKP
jgi:hypothetical protein